MQNTYEVNLEAQELGRAIGIVEEEHLEITAKFLRLAFLAGKNNKELI